MLTDTRSLVFILVALLMPRNGLPRPQIDSDEDIDISRVRSPKYSLEALRPNDAAMVFLNNKQLHSAVISVLDQLPEEDLRVLEELVPPEEFLQGDMPIEDSPPVPIDDLNVTLSSLNTSDSDLPYPELQKANRER